jgi:hypothetical protein
MVEFELLLGDQSPTIPQRAGKVPLIDVSVHDIVMIFNIVL